MTDSGAPAELDLARCQEVAVALARQAGAVIVAAFDNADKGVENKSELDWVTVTDKRCEQIILDGLRAAFPTHALIGEESADDAVQLTDAPTWMVDPLDGTTNFVHSNAYCCVSIGLCVARESVLGVVYQPVGDVLYTAVRGGGAFRNGVRLHVSANDTLPSTQMSTGLPKYREFLEFDLGWLYPLLADGKLGAVRMNGSCALDLCQIAQGSSDAYMECGAICCWDYCAGTRIVLEAGGAVIDPITGGAVDLMKHRCLAGASEKVLREIAAHVAARKAPPSVGKVPREQEQEATPTTTPTTTTTK